MVAYPDCPACGQPLIPGSEMHWYRHRTGDPKPCSMLGAAIGGRLIFIERTEDRTT